MKPIQILLCLLAMAAAAGIQAAPGPDGAIPGFTAVQRGSGLSLHKSNYILPATWSEDWSGASTEVIYQLSIKQRLFINNLYAGYTQKSFWQAYNHAISAPFRETNYNPEVFYRWLPGDDMFRRLHLDRWGFDAGFEHESNGQLWPQSRSLNRIYFAPFRTSNDSQALWYLKTWYRIPENEKNGPLDSGGDDNPDYYKYFGWAQLEYQRHFDNQWMLHAMTRGNPASGRGAFELRFSIPATDQSFFWVASLFTGYGESLIDYDQDNTRIGLGIMFNR